MMEDVLHSVNIWTFWRDYFYKVPFSAGKSHFWELYKDIEIQNKWEIHPLQIHPKLLSKGLTTSFHPTPFSFFQFETDGATRPARVGLGGQNHNQTVPATIAASAAATTNGKRVSVLSKTVVHENKKNMATSVPDETEEPLIEVLHEEEAAAVNSSNGHGNKTTVAVINATNVTNNGQVHETHL